MIKPYLIRIQSKYIQNRSTIYVIHNMLIIRDFSRDRELLLLYQPPYSPQVNPSERLWQWSKGEISDTLLSNLETLKATLNHLFLSKPKEFFASLTHRQFISDALQKIGMLPNNI